jgi:FkbM family methyltransferase
LPRVCAGHSACLTHLVMMRKLIRAPIRTVVRTLVTNPAGLRLVNAMHYRLSPGWRQRFYYLCCDPTWRVSGRWSVDVAGRQIVLPLTRDFPDAWLSAIGFHGYDAELHALYEALLRGPRPPRVVFDVGAHYGLHTLRFLVHGARVLAFEPNPYCHRWLRAWCAANGVACELEPVALVEAAATVVLTVPQSNTCMASVLPDARDRWRDGDFYTVSVRQVALDDIVAQRGLVPDLVKIDTEGAELSVLRGAVDLLRTAHPRSSSRVGVRWRRDARCGTCSTSTGTRSPPSTAPCRDRSRAPTSPTRARPTSSPRCRPGA